MEELTTEQEYSRCLASFPDYVKRAKVIKASRVGDGDHSITLSVFYKRFDGEPEEHCPQFLLPHNTVLGLGSLSLALLSHPVRNTAWRISFKIRDEKTQKVTNKHCDEL